MMIISFYYAKLSMRQRKKQGVKYSRLGSLMLSLDMAESLT